ncbi:hypothetical protein WEH80_02015 [Actinomycetes bacterium KLBMP 9759]
MDSSAVLVSLFMGYKGAHEGCQCGPLVFGAAPNGSGALDAVLVLVPVPVEFAVLVVMGPLRNAVDVVTVTGPWLPVTM